MPDKFYSIVLDSIIVVLVVSVIGALGLLAVIIREMLR